MGISAIKAIRLRTALSQKRFVTSSSRHLSLNFKIVQFLLRARSFISSLVLPRCVFTAVLDYAVPSTPPADESVLTEP